MVEFNRSRYSRLNKRVNMLYTTVRERFLFAPIVLIDCTEIMTFYIHYHTPINCEGGLINKWIDTFTDLCIRHVLGEPGGSVSIVSGYGLDDRAIKVRSSAEAKDELSTTLLHVWTCSTSNFLITLTILPLTVSCQNGRVDAILEFTLFIDSLSYVRHFPIHTACELFIMW
jgi:hypothetical protein